MPKYLGLIILFAVSGFAGALRAQHADTICAGLEPLWYVVDEHPGSRYSWRSDGGVIVGSSQQSSVVVQWPAIPGLYSLSVTEHNAFGCPGDPVTYHVFVKRKQVTVNAPTEACIGTVVNMSVNGGMNFRWSTGDTQSTAGIRVLSDTVIRVVVKDTVCSVTIDTFDLFVRALYVPKPYIDDPEGDIYKGQTIDIISPGGNGMDRKWGVNKGWIRSKIEDGVRVSFIDTGRAHVRLVVTNDFGCSDSAEKEVNVKGEHIYMPTAFTPDADGLNDLFRPYGTGLKSWTLEVYNRWGQLIFSGNERGNGWDGKYLGIPVPADGYVYLCEGFGYSGKRFAVKGTITVLR